MTDSSNATPAVALLLHLGSTAEWQLDTHLYESPFGLMIRQLPFPVPLIVVRVDSSADAVTLHKRCVTFASAEVAATVTVPDTSLHTVLTMCDAGIIADVNRTMDVTTSTSLTMDGVGRSAVLSKPRDALEAREQATGIVNRLMMLAGHPLAPQGLHNSG